MSKFVRFVIERRWWFLLLVPVFCLLVASGGANLRFTNDYRVYFSEDNPQLLAFEAMEQTYTRDDNVVFLLEPAGGEVFSAQVMQAVLYLTEQAWQIPYSLRVDSLSNFQHTRAEEDDVVVLDLVPEEAELTPELLEQVRAVALSEPQLRGRLVSLDSKVTAVNITVQLPRRDETLEGPEVVAAARALAEDMEQRFSGIEVRLSGITVMNNAFSEESQGDMQTVVPASFALMLVILGVLLRSLVAVLSTLVVIMLSVVAAMGVGGFLGFPITPPSASSPTIILTVAIAGSVHLLVNFFQEFARTQDRQAAVAESLRLNLQPIALTGLTTAIGFLTLNFSDAPPFRHLGIIVAAGVLFAFVLTVTFLPALLSVLPLKQRRVRTAGDGSMRSLAEWVIRHSRQLFWGGLALALGLIACVPLNVVNDNFVEYFDERVEFRRDADFFDKHLGGLYWLDFALESGEPGGINDPQVLQQMDAFTDWLRTQPEVVHVNSIVDTYKRLNKNMHGDREEWYRLPESRELAAQYLLLYEMSLPYGLDLNNQINVSKSATRIRASTRSISSSEMLVLEKRMSDWLADNAPAVQVQIASPTVMFAHIGQRNNVSMLKGTFIALVLISFLIMLAVRSVKIGLISLVPNLLPAAIGFGIWGLLEGEVGLAISVVAGMSLGIVVDDTIHFLSKYLRARRESGASAPTAIGRAFSGVGSAMLVTTLVLVAGFLVLSLSNFEPNSGMGLLTSIVLSVALVADFFLLPSLLLRLEEKHNG